MSELVDEEYDAILLGTGMTESILAAALARAGRRILHLDANKYYGSEAATLTFDQLLEWSQALASADSSPSRATSDLRFDQNAGFYFLQEYCPDRQLLSQQSHRFNMDLTCQILLNADSLVELIIQSGVGRYFECTSVDQTSILLQASPTASSPMVYKVPCSKTDVFQTKLLEMKEKRLLMKFLQTMADVGDSEIKGRNVLLKNENDLDEVNGRSLKRPQNKALPYPDHQFLTLVQDQTFLQVLQSHFKFSEKLQQIILYAVALVSEPKTEVALLSAREGIARVYEYLISIGRFEGTKTAFLYPLYGLGELGQSFCRMSAVYGGIYYLNSAFQTFQLKSSPDSDNKACTGLTLDDNRILRGKWIITNPVHVSDKYTCLRKSRKVVLRKLVIAKQPLFGEQVIATTEKDQDRGRKLVLIIPPATSPFQNPSAIHVVQLNHKALVCPEGYFVWQFSTIGSLESDKGLLTQVMEHLLQPAGSDEVLYSLDFAKSIFSQTSASDLPSNVLVSAPTRETPAAAEELEINFNEPVQVAKALFTTICPGEEFLPKSESAKAAEADELQDEETVPEHILQATAQTLNEKELPHPLSHNSAAAVYDL